MEMSRGMIGKIHQDYYPIEETNLWHTIYFNKTAILSGFTFRALYNIYDAKKVQIESRTCQACLSNYAEMQPFLCKESANREQNLPSLLDQLCRDAAFLMQNYTFSFI